MEAPNWYGYELIPFGYKGYRTQSWLVPYDYNGLSVLILPVQILKPNSPLPGAFQLPTLTMIYLQTRVNRDGSVWLLNGQLIPSGISKKLFVFPSIPVNAWLSQ